MTAEMAAARQTGARRRKRQTGVESGGKTGVESGGTTGGESGGTDGREQGRGRDTRRRTPVVSGGEWIDARQGPEGEEGRTEGGRTEGGCTEGGGGGRPCF